MLTDEGLDGAFEAGLGEPLGKALGEVLGEVLGGGDLGSLSDEVLHERVLVCEALAGRLAAATAGVVSVWDARRVWASDGSRSAGARLARDAHRAPAAMRAEVRRARRLRTMAATAAAFETGKISVEHVDALVVANQARFVHLFARDEHILVGHAIELSFPDFHRAVRYWIHIAEDDITDPTGDHQHESRSASSAQTKDGTWDTRARHDPIDGAIFHNEWARLERRLFETDWAAARLIHGDDTRLDHLTRTSDQRRADALVEMATRSAAKAPGAKEPRVLVTVVVDRETLTGRICELLNGTVIAPDHIARHLTKADIERVIFAGKSRVIDVGTRTRFFTGALRRAIEIRDRHCTFEGCTTPAQACDIDHITPYAQGGPTTQTNGRLRCPPHNRHPTNNTQPTHNTQPGRTTPPTTGP